MFFKHRFTRLSPSGSPLKTDMRISMAAANLSAMVAVFLTSPLDRFVYRSQTVDRESNNNDKRLKKDRDCSAQDQSLVSAVMRQFEGVLPSLLLCINPAIYYAVYDRLKYEVLAFRNTSSGRHEQFLESSDAFLVSIIAKLIATFATYPLVRAKLLMMIEGKPEVDKRFASENNDERQKSSGDCSEISKLVDTIYGTLQRGGITDLYRGVFMHFIYAAIRSSTSMVVKERLNHFFDSIDENKIS